MTDSNQGHVKVDWGGNTTPINFNKPIYFNSQTVINPFSSPGKATN